MTVFFSVVAATLVLCLGVIWQAGARERQFEAEFPPSGQIIEVEGLRVHAHVMGQDGPDLVLIHGSSGNMRDFSFSLAGALAQDYRVILLDRPGLGYSERLPGDESIHAQARVLQAATEALGASRPIVLGQSYGGAVALAWAVDHPETLSALVLVSAPSQPWEGPIPLLYRLNSSALGSTLAVPLITALVPRRYIETQIRDVFDPEPMPEGYDTHIGAELAARQVSLRANAAQRAGLLEEIRALQPRYDALDLPIELIHGDRDQIVSLRIHSEPFLEQVPQARLDRLAGAGHLPHITREEATLAAIQRAAERAGLR